MTGNGNIKQPIEFNHKIHIVDAGLTCGDCHKYYDQLKRAGIPNIDDCAECHSEQIGESSQELKVVESIQSETMIPWRHVNVLPNHVYFSHMRHVKIGRMECARCHGAMEDREKPMKKPFKPITMNWCIDCHEKNNVSNDCLYCHK